MLPLVALAKFVPAIAGWIGGDDAEEVTSTVLDVAKQVTGADDDDVALDLIQSNPDMQVAFQQAMNPVIIARLENETKQQAEVNATIRAELNSNDKFKSWWRPALGWTVVINFGALMSAIVFVIVWGALKDPKIVGTFITSLSTLIGTLTVIWSMALAVLGVNIKKRSDDKALAVGHPPKQNLLGSLANKWLAK